MFLPNGYCSFQGARAVCPDSSEPPITREDDTTGVLDGAVTI